jgi:hypothetical protein
LSLLSRSPVRFCSLLFAAIATILSLSLNNKVVHCHNVITVVVVAGLTLFTSSRPPLHVGCRRCCARSLLSCSRLSPGLPHRCRWFAVCCRQRCQAIVRLSQVVVAAVRVVVATAVAFIVCQLSGCQGCRCLPPLLIRLIAASCLLLSSLSLLSAGHSSLSVVAVIVSCHRCLAPPALTLFAVIKAIVR